MTSAVTIPTLRSIVGQMMMRRSSAPTTNRGLYTLLGALTNADLAVQGVINALVAAVESIGEETITRGKASLQTDFVDYTFYKAAATETAWSLDIGSGVAASYLFEFDIAAVSDDGLDHSAYVVRFAVRWDGSSVTQTAAVSAEFTAETDAAASACTADISGTTVRLRVGATADWRYGGVVRITKMEF